MSDDEHTDPRVPLLLLLSMTTGLVDAASVLGLGKVFTANMTGNVVFLGFAVAGAAGFVWPPFLVAMGSFLTGALIAGRIGKAQAARSARRWLLTAAVFEASLLWIAAIVAITSKETLPAGAHRYAIIALTGAAMGFRNATVRQMKVADLTTTVLTQTLTGLAADSTAAGGANPNWQRRIGAVVAIFVGSAAGAVLLYRCGLATPLGVSGAIILLGTIAFLARSDDRVAGH